MFNGIRLSFQDSAINIIWLLVTSVRKDDRTVAHQATGCNDQSRGGQRFGKETERRARSQAWILCSIADSFLQTAKIKQSSSSVYLRLKICFETRRHSPNPAEGEHNRLSTVPGRLDT